VFLIASGDKGYSYFQCLKKNDIWTDECEEAFGKLKEYLVNPPVLSKPTIGIPIRLYFSVTDQAISSVILQEEGKAQKPIYFIRKVLHGAEVRYQAIEKETLAMVFTLDNFATISKVSPWW